MTEPVANEAPTAPRVYTVEQAAEQLQVSEKTVRRLIKDEKLRSVLVSPRALRIPIDAIDEYLERAAS